MSNDMPDKAFLRHDKNGLKYWTPITEQPYEDSMLYYSESHVQQLMKEAEERQLLGIKAKIFKGIKGCGDNSCLIEKPTSMATNGGCRCRDNRGKMAIILSRLSAILNAGGE